MSDSPAKTHLLGHRRAHSEIPGLPDDISFDENEENLVSLFLDIEKFGELSVSNGKEEEEEGETRIRHQHSQSMDGPGSSGSGGGSSELVDLALVDPKRAKRISANRQSAARSKERKVRYISELERSIQALEMEKVAVSTHLAMLRRETSEIRVGNNELKLHLYTLAQNKQLRCALNDKLREDIEHLKLVTGENIAATGSMMNYGPSQVPNQPFYPSNLSMQNVMAAHQFQQPQFQSQQSHQLQQQLTGDVNFNGSFPSTQLENSADNPHSANGLGN